MCVITITVVKFVGHW